MGEEEGGGGRGKFGSSSLNRIGLEKIFLVASSRSLPARSARADLKDGD